MNYDSPVLYLNLPKPPSGMTVTGLINGSEPLSLTNGIIDINQTGQTDFQLLITPSGNDSTNVSSFNMQLGTQGNAVSMGIIGFVAGTVITSAIALLIAIPLALGAAIFLYGYCPSRIRDMCQNH